MLAKKINPINVRKYLIIHPTTPVLHYLNILIHDNLLLNFYKWP